VKSALVIAAILIIAASGLITERWLARRRKRRQRQADEAELQGIQTATEARWGP
jgi:HAMP domain-containing protein